jgi:hypothetical protein
MLLKMAILCISDSMFKRDRWEVRDWNANNFYHFTIQPFFLYLLELIMNFIMLIIYLSFIPWGEKLVVFIEFKKRDLSALRPQDDRERLNDKH